MQNRFFKIIPILLLAANAAWADPLENVKISDVTLSKGSVRLRVQNGSSPEAYFFVDVTRDDPKSFEKLGLVTKKLVAGEKFRLDMSIVSFSAHPGGSYYRSKDVTFIDHAAGVKTR